MKIVIESENGPVRIQLDEISPDSAPTIMHMQVTHLVTGQMFERDLILALYERFARLYVDAKIISQGALADPGLVEPTAPQ